MAGSRYVLLAVLVYVTLDLSLPFMPGAFVFEPSESVESTQSSRPRTAADSVMGGLELRESVAAVVPEGAFSNEAMRRRDAPSPSLQPRMKSRPSLLHTVTDPSPSSEDPH